MDRNIGLREYAGKILPYFKLISSGASLPLRSSGDASCLRALAFLWGRLAEVQLGCQLDPNHNKIVRGQDGGWPEARSQESMRAMRLLMKSSNRRCSQSLPTKESPIRTYRSVWILFWFMIEPILFLEILLVLTGFMTNEVCLYPCPKPINAIGLIWLWGQMIHPKNDVCLNGKLGSNYIKTSKFGTQKIHDS